MPRNQGTAVDSNFSAGFITEATGLNFPPNSCKETINCVHNQIGSITRRLGIDFEIANSFKDADLTNCAIVSYLWKNVAGDSVKQLVVVQIGSTLYFYDASTTEPLSYHPIAWSVDLSDFTVTSLDSLKAKECQFASGNGLLFVVHPECEAFYISFDMNTQTGTTNQITLKIRDFKGLEDGYKVDERPNTDYSGLPTAKKYNLFNQGWTIENLMTWDAGRDDMPSGADVMWIHKDSNEDFTLDNVDKIYVGNSPAPKGKYVLDLYNQDRGDVSGLTIAPEVIDARCRTVAFFAGRVFYAGLDQEGYNSKIFFSQIVESPDQYGKAHQINDPTSETLFDLLPIDGGVIDIRECGNIIKIYPQGMGLAVFASNGVWFISGSTGLGFTATDYSIVKIAETSSLTSSSFVEIKGQMSWWNLEGIQLLRVEGAGGSVSSLTEPKIKQYYNTIPVSAKRRASGFFNTITGVVQWLYRTKEANSAEELYETQQILNLNTNTGAFYIWEPADSDAKIYATVVLEHRGGDVDIENVVDNGNSDVLDNGGDPVTAYIIDNAIVIPKFKYLTAYKESPGVYKITFSEAYDEGYVDWASYDTEDYVSTFTTGYSVRGEANKDFQNNYVTLYSSNTSVYNVRGMWEWSNSGDSGKWTSSQHINNTHKADFDYVPRKIKVRGQGKAVQIKISSSTGDPFDISGWVTNVSGNTVV